MTKKLSAVIVTLTVAGVYHGHRQIGVCVGTDWRYYSERDNAGTWWGWYGNKVDLC